VIRALPTVSLSLLLLVVSAGAALGVTTVSRSGNTFTITGGDEVNSVEILAPGGSAGAVRFRDPAGLVVGEGCADAGNFSADCGVPGPGLVANVTLGAGNDRLQPETATTTFPAVVVDLGPGDDISSGSAGNDTIAGGDGNDDVNGGAGQDTIDGGAGNDRLSGSAGNDIVTGGAGVDNLFGDGDFSLGHWGDDTLNADDGEIDRLSCSIGRDTAVFDANDKFAALGDCELITIGGGATPNIRLGAPAAPGLAALLSGKPIRTRVTISAPGLCFRWLVVLKGEAKRLKLGDVVVFIGNSVSRIYPAGAHSVALSVSKEFRTKLRGQDRVRITVVVACEAGRKRSDSAERTVVVKK
jgi:RTX calcium-binding nonapeptide repeat (4 copies)